MRESYENGGSYNDRLFGRAGLRSCYHLTRFKWAERQFIRLGSRLKVVELGCFDGRLLSSVRRNVAEYVGLDANWEGGLDLARARFANAEGVQLMQADRPDAFRAFADGHFDVAVALETLEHVPPELVGPFLAEMARVTNGVLLVSVPNEMGPIFLAKYALKWLRYGDAESYSAREIMAAAMGRPSEIARCQHKGFDYRTVIAEIAKRFEIASVEGLPRTGLPAWLSPTVAIVARSQLTASLPPPALFQIQDRPLLRRGYRGRPSRYSQPKHKRT